MKKILITIFLLIIGSLYVIKYSYGEEDTNCAYQKKLDTCKKANEDGNTRSISESEGFICIEGSDEEILYQVVLDEKFNEIDEEIDEYLTKLEDDKDKYFGENAEGNYIEASDEIENKFSNWGEYWNRYNDVCGVELIQEVISCQGGEASVLNSSEYFKNSTCMSLAELKLNIYRQVAYDILMLNKLSVLEDSSKEHMQTQRTSYDELLNSMMINAGYMERISKKWPSVLKNTH